MEKSVFKFFKKFKFILLIVLLFAIIQYSLSNFGQEGKINVEIKCEPKSVDETKEQNEKFAEYNRLGDNFVRDFYRYECASMKRYGSSYEDPMYRIDGSYFVCNDGNLAPRKSDCVVLSFGVNTYDTFEESIASELNCIIHSFDPFIEPSRVSSVRNENTHLKNSVTVPISQKWYFHSLGITNKERIKNVNKIGWLDTYTNILTYISMHNKIIDVLKIDTEGAEYESLPYIMNTEPDLLCKYVKQIAIETHSWLYNHTHNYRVVQSLELCFRLFRRDQRFYESLAQTEWQLESFKLELNKFKNEVELAKWLFTYGELYFVNVNFLSF